MAQTLGSSKLVATIDTTVESAIDKVKKLLPYKEGHEAYRYLNIKTVDFKDNRVAAVALYELKPRHADRVTRSGAGSYETEMERRINVEYQ